MLVVKIRRIPPTVHFIAVCQRLFGDNFIITCFILELKLTCYTSMFFMSSGTKFQLDPAKDKTFPIDPISKIAHFGNVMSIDRQMTGRV